ncbi:MAG TPA: phosphatidate cytidylyltransferase [Blastocatellia bacterium]|nr:phosphatidate cytidylyltransferase [Blastocatellia bacterium]
MKRILTAAVVLPILLFTIWTETPYFFVALAAVAAVLALGEFYNLASKVGCPAQPALGLVAALIVVACFVLERSEWIVAVIAGLTMGSLGLALAKPDQIKKSLLTVACTVTGVVYVAVLAGCLVGVRMMPDSMTQPLTPHLSSKLLMMFFAMVVFADTGAFYTGHLIGRHKLAPRVSPGKTIEGAIGGLLAAIAAGPLSRLVFFHEIPIAHAIVLGALIGVLGPIGDLAESMLKRGSGVKDSGTLLPGHGGVLDRVDSILFCAPLLYYYSRLFISRM